MTPRLKHVINQLYHPDLSRRQVLAVSRWEAEVLPRLPSVAMISITAPGEVPALVHGFENLLRLEFADVDFLSTELSPRARAKLPYAFTAEQAKRIRSFVEGLPPNVHSIVVHCGGGFSRSCAVARGLHLIYGYAVETDRLKEANPSVVAVLTAQRAGRSTK